MFEELFGLDLPESVFSFCAAVASTTLKYIMEFEKNINMCRDIALMKVFSSFLVTSVYDLQRNVSRSNHWHSMSAHLFVLFLEQAE